MQFLSLGADGLRPHEVAQGGTELLGGLFARRVVVRAIAPFQTGAQGVALRLEGAHPGQPAPEADDLLA